MLDPTPATLISWLADFPARTSAWPAQGPASTAHSQDSGAKWPGLLATFDPDSFSWKTVQHSLLADSALFLETWPDSGMTVGGRCYQRPTSVPRICGDASGSSVIWPTPTAQDAEQAGGKGAIARGTRGLSLHQSVRIPTPTAQDASGHAQVRGINAHGKRGTTLAGFARLFQTPAARDYRSPNAKPYAQRGGGTKGEQLPNFVGGQLSPEWVEWLMGWPIGHTASAHLETGRYREWLQQHSPCWLPNSGRES